MMKRLREEKVAICCLISKCEPALRSGFHILKERLLFQESIKNVYCQKKLKR